MAADKSRSSSPAPTTSSTTTNPSPREQLDRKNKAVVDNSTATFGPGSSKSPGNPSSNNNSNNPIASKPGRQDCYVANAGGWADDSKSVTDLGFEISDDEGDSPEK